MEDPARVPPPPAKAVRSARRIALSLLLGGLLAGLLLKSLDLRQVAHALRSADPTLIAVSLLCYVGSYACRAARFRLILHSCRPPLLDLFGVVSVHNLFNMLLPMRTGELSFVYLARQRWGASLTEGLVALLLARLYDMLGIAVFFVTAIVAERSRVQGEVGALVGLGASLLLLTALLLIGLLPLVRLVTSRLDERVRRNGAASSSLLLKVVARLRDILASLEDIQRRRTARWVFVVTELQWLCTFLTCWLVVRALDIAFPFDLSILGSTGLSVALILPINTFANVGTFEAGWIAGYRLAGMAAASATLSAVVAHVFIMLFAAVLGLGGHWLLARQPR